PLYDSKYGRLVYLTAEDPATLWAELKQQFDDNQDRAPSRGDYWKTFLVPSVAQWPSAGWASFERKISESDSYEYSKSTSWSGGVAVGWGLFSFGGGAGGSSDYRYRQSSASSVSLKFDYLRVKISRPWLVEDIFGYKFWTWKKVFGGQMISDG